MKLMTIIAFGLVAHSGTAHACGPIAGLPAQQAKETCIKINDAELREACLKVNAEHADELKAEGVNK